jgi:hypothetical protein
MSIFTDISRFVNPGGLINAVNDPMPGGVRNGVAGIQTAVDPGQLGSYYYLTAGEAIQRYGNVLFSGLYQYVQVVATSSAPAQGLGAYFSVLPTSYTNSLQNYIVTATATVENESFFAGVFLNAITPGNYGWIQVGGIATVKYKAAFTGAAAIGVVVASDPAGSNLFDVPVQSAAQLPSVTKTYVGTAITLPVVNTLGQVQLKGVGWSF